MADVFEKTWLGKWLSWVFTISVFYVVIDILQLYLIYVWNVGVSYRISEYVMNSDILWLELAFGAFWVQWPILLIIAVINLIWDGLVWIFKKIFS